MSHRRDPPYRSAVAPETDASESGPAHIVCVYRSTTDGRAQRRAILDPGTDDEDVQQPLIDTAFARVRPL
ncbi:hypothetical protein [Halomarina oriensis]|uniref:Uncharacterized protein n=1 Tax=Halomarina oriensis TaxID=671145 RepID=A0A6B0GWI5_9EURY|nr:hypothetical protein [Halomarina oriensis]MWG36505.1 hypothetical protein [Halomarina oriensis]